MSEEKPTQAHAVGYDPGEPAPRLLAAGQGRVAERIIELARELHIPVRSDPDLSAVLQALDTGSYIPEQLYQAFALILAGIYTANRQFR